MDGLNKKQYDIEWKNKKHWTYKNCGICWIFNIGKCRMDCACSWVSYQIGNDLDVCEGQWSLGVMWCIDFCLASLDEFCVCSGTKIRNNKSSTMYHGQQSAVNHICVMYDHSQCCGVVMDGSSRYVQGLLSGYSSELIILTSDLSYMNHNLSFIALWTSLKLYDDISS